MQINIKTLGERLQWFSAGSQSEMDVKCKENVMTWYSNHSRSTRNAEAEDIYESILLQRQWLSVYCLDSTENSSNNQGTKVSTKQFTCPSNTF